MIIGFAIGGTLVLALLMLLIYKLVKWMQEKIHQVKNISIKLPKGLDGPEMNPLNNYERFKQGLQSAQTASNEQLVHVANEKEKYRHNSGGSHFSSSSTDALILKNGKCAKFGRKPSGDSSGCSSLSSNTVLRPHLSDSGTESDIAIPPSPDSAIGELSLLNLHKTPLPILIEVHDQRNSELSSAHQSPISSFRQPKYSNVASDIVLKVDQPFSKFGVAGNIHGADTGRLSSLAFYSSNLANSEPSIFETRDEKQNPSMMAPYSKVGLAKSSEDILGMTLNSIGYSKFGFPTVKEKFSVSLNANSNYILTDASQNGCGKFTKPDGRMKSSKVKTSPYALAHEELQRCADIKYGINSSSGYVPFSDLKGQESSSSVPSISASSSTNLYSFHQVDKNNDDYLYDVGWPSQNLSESGNGSTEPKEIPFGDLFFQKGTPDVQLCTDYNFKFTFPDDPDLASDRLFSVYNGGNLISQAFDNHNFYDQFPDHQSGKNASLSSENCNLSEDSQSDGAYSSQTDNSGEILITPLTLKNNYVPISTLTDDRTFIYVPNPTAPESPNLSTYSNGFCTESKNALNVQSADGVFLHSELGKSKLASALDQNNSQLKSSFKNGMKYVNGSLKHILKPFPKVESEVCEV